MNLRKSVFNKIKIIVPDSIYLKFQYKHHFGKNLNLKEPRTFNEKIQWLKLHDRKSDYTKYVDKYEVRNYIKDSIGEEYLIPLLGVYNNVDEINWEELPNKFVLKCTHGSSCNIICTDKTKLDIKESKKQLNTWMKKNWYWYGREWPYKNAEPKIICEKFLEQKEGEELRDYRLFCFHGQPKMITVDFSITDKKKTRRNIYDLEWNSIDAEISYPKETSIDVKKPAQLDKIIELSKILSANFRHARIDFYIIEEKVYFGEITFYHQSGYGKISPPEFDKEMGDWLNIS